MIPCFIQKKTIDNESHVRLRFTLCGLTRDPQLIIHKHSLSEGQL